MPSPFFVQIFIQTENMKKLRSLNHSTITLEMTVDVSHNTICTIVTFNTFQQFHPLKSNRKNKLITFNYIFPAEGKSINQFPLFVHQTSNQKRTLFR